MSRIGTDPDLGVSSGDEFWARELSARDPGKIGGQLTGPSRLVRHAASFGPKSGVLSGTRCVSASGGFRPALRAGFTRIPRRIRGKFGFGSIWL